MTFGDLKPGDHFTFEMHGHSPAFWGTWVKVTDDHAVQLAQGEYSEFAPNLRVEKQLDGQMVLADDGWGFDGD